MKINNKFKAEWDGRQWILTEAYEGKDKQGAPKTHFKESYHATLRQVSKYIINSTAAACASLEQVIDAMEKAEWKLEGDLRGFV